MWTVRRELEHDAAGRDEHADGDLEQFQPQDHRLSGHHDSGSEPLSRPSGPVSRLASDSRMQSARVAPRADMCFLATTRRTTKCLAPIRTPQDAPRPMDLATLASEINATR